MAKQRNNPVEIPKGIEVQVSEGRVKVKGSLGTMEISLSPRVMVEKKENRIFVKNKDNSKESAAHQGTTRSLIINQIYGVSKGFEKTLVIQGTGYRAQMSGTGLQLFLGFSKPKTITLPKGIKCELKVVKSAEKGDLTYITVKGTNKELVGDIAAKIRKTRNPDPYKHKGVRYEDEVIRKKVGKRAVVQA